MGQASAGTPSLKIATAAAACGCHHPPDKKGRVVMKAPEEKDDHEMRVTKTGLNLKRFGRMG